MPETLNPVKAILQYVQEAKVPKPWRLVDKYRPGAVDHNLPREYTKHNVQVLKKGQRHFNTHRSIDRARAAENHESSNKTISLPKINLPLDPLYVAWRTAIQRRKDTLGAPLSDRRIYTRSPTSLFFSKLKE